MIKHYLSTKTKKVTGFNRFSKFVVLGNNIDGMVSIKHEEFENWADFTTRFPEMYKNIDFFGEWSLNIYQVPDDYKLKYKYGYYKVPDKGKMIADIGYMEIAGEQIDVFISNALIHFQSRSTAGTENWDNDIDFDTIVDINTDTDIDDENERDFEVTEIFEQYLTILLHEELDCKTFNDIDYPGNAGNVHHEIYTKVIY